jgi:SAM-dependent methyltransferase
VPPGFKRNQLRQRYDVSDFREDEWHSYSGEQTWGFIKNHLSHTAIDSKRLLNAGSGVYEMKLSGWTEISLDIFSNPLRNRSCAICANVEQLPFDNDSFAAVTCVGEVLGYCDPAAAIKEFERVLDTNGMLICDFASTRSIRHLFKRSYGRAAEIVSGYYNQITERTWAYDPNYICALLSAYGFSVKEKHGTHFWSSFARRFGLTDLQSLSIQRQMEWLPLIRFADVMTIVAVKI